MTRQSSAFHAPPASRRRLLVALMAALAACSVLTLQLLAYQAAGADYSCFWAGGLGLRRRPLLAGVLLGVGAAIKPQIFLLVPLALAADRQWRTMLAAGVTGAALAAASALVWGVDVWRQWLQALPRFNDVVFNR